MKIALIVPGGVDRSGTDRVIPCILWLIERLAAGDEVHVFATGQEPKPGHWRLLGATVHNAGWRPQGITTLALMAVEQAKGRFDVVHAFWASSCGVIGAIAAKLFGCPLILTLPGGDVARLPSIRYGALMTRRGRALVAWSCAQAAVVTAPSQTMCDLAASRLKISVKRLPLGVAIDLWPSARPRERDPAALLHLVHVADLNRVKDQGTLLRAMAILRESGLEFQLNILGSDTLKGEIQRLTAGLQLETCVHFAGRVPFHALRPWLERADLLVMSSQHEAGPLVTLEAAVAGVPTVGTAVGHIADFSPDAAMATPVGDAERLAGAIRELVEDEPRRLKLAANAQQRALAEDADFTAREVRALYAANRRQGRNSNSL